MDTQAEQHDYSYAYRDFALGEMVIDDERRALYSHLYDRLSTATATTHFLGCTGWTKAGRRRVFLYPASTISPYPN